eukprot:bmy_05114T0
MDSWAPECQWMQRGGLIFWNLPGHPQKRNIGNQRESSHSDNLRRETACGFPSPVEGPGCGQEQVVGVAGTPEPDPPVDASGDERPTWGNKLQNLLSCVGFAVAMGNLRRSRTRARPTGEVSRAPSSVPTTASRVVGTCRPWGICPSEAQWPQLCGAAH